MKWKQPLFGLVAILLALGLVELVLWIAGVSTLLEERDPYRGFSERIRVFEPDAERGVLHTRAAAVRHSFHYEEFLGKKPEDGYRVFVLGGSSVYGFPWGGEIAFPRLLGDALREAWPERTIEVINVGAMSYGSHRLRILAAELLEHRPDALVIYTGHNEFVERRFYRELMGEGATRRGLRGLLFRWRLYAAMTRAYEKVAPAPSREIDPRAATTGELLGLDVVRDFTAEVDGSDRRDGVTRFEENIVAILEMAGRHDVPVILCTVPSNLTDWMPGQSLFPRELGLAGRREVAALMGEAARAMDAGAFETGIGPLERAGELAPTHAGVSYLLGRAYAQSGRWDEAREAFVLARDLDAQPARASSELNEVVRRLGGRPGALLVDVEKSFAEASPHGLPGFNLFEDYVHPKPQGHRRIAWELWKRFEEDGLAGEPRPADEALFARAVEATVGSGAGRSDGPEALGGANTPQMLFNLAVVLENQGRLAQAMRNYRQCVALDPGYFVARANLARLLIEAGRYAEALEEYRRVLEVEPRHVGSQIGLGETLRRMGRLEGAEQAFVRATRLDAGSSAAWNSLGVTRMQLGRPGEAETDFRRADELNPEHADTLANLGLSLLAQRRLDDAETAFRSALRSRPDQLAANNGLAAVLIERGQLDEAERMFRQSLLLDPNDPMARDGLARIRQEKTKR